MVDPTKLKPRDLFKDEYGDICEVLEVEDGMVKCLDTFSDGVLNYIATGSNDYFPWDTAVMIEPETETETKKAEQV